MEIWNLENHTIEGTYLGVPFRGTVMQSRESTNIKAGIEHTVLLEKPIIVKDRPRALITINTAEDTADYYVVDFK